MANTLLKVGEAKETYEMKRAGRSILVIAQRQGVLKSLVRRLMKILDVALPPARVFKDVWDWMGGEAGEREAGTLRPIMMNSRQECRRIAWD